MTNNSYRFLPALAVAMPLYLAGCSFAQQPTTPPDAVFTDDAGTTPLVDDSGLTPFDPPVCEGVADHVTHLRVTVVSPTLLGPCGGTWSAFALFDNRTVGTSGEQFDQLVPDADLDGEYDWNGYVQFGFQCSSDGYWKTGYMDGTTASAMGVQVTVWYVDRQVDMSQTRVFNQRLTVGLHESCDIL